MVTGQELFQLVLWVSLGCWLIMLARELWFFCRVTPDQVLFLLVQDQEEIIEGLVYYLSRHRHKIEGNRWDIVIVDLGSQDHTRKILRRQISCRKANLTLVTLAREDEENFIEGLAKKQVQQRIVVLALTGKADGREVCARIGKILAGDIGSYPGDLHPRGRLQVLQRSK